MIFDKVVKGEFVVGAEVSENWQETVKKHISTQ